MTTLQLKLQTLKTIVQRARFWGVWVLALLAAYLLYVTDPDHGLSTRILLLTVLSGSLAVGFAHSARKSLYDYIDIQSYAEKAQQNSIGAGLVVLAMSIVMYGLLNLFGGLLHV